MNKKPMAKQMKIYKKGSKRWVFKECPNCKVFYKVQPNRYKNRIFCSRDCANIRLTIRNKLKRCFDCNEWFMGTRNQLFCLRHKPKGSGLNLGGHNKFEKHLDYKIAKLHHDLYGRN